MKITLHRGAKEIGGSCVELTTKTTRLLIDIGQPLSGDNVVLSQNLKSVDAVLISHPHMDHFGLLDQIPNDIPVYIGELGMKFIQATKLFIERPLLTNLFCHFNKWEKFFIGDFEITPFLMDHSAVDAYAFLIETEGKSIFYSGDFRGHGRKSILFDKLTENSWANVDVMLMEGTMLGRLKEKPPDESNIEEKMVKVLKIDAELSFLICSAQNIDRLVSAYRACLRSGRTFVLDIYTAWVLRLLNDTLRTGKTPNLNWSKVKVLSKGWTAGRQYGIVKKNRAIFGEFCRELYASKNVLSSVDLRGGKEKFLIKTSYTGPLIKQLTLGHVSIIYSMWEGYLTKEHNPCGFENYQNLMNNPDIEFYKIHTSGHAVLKDLQKLAAAVNPRILIPIHTEHATDYDNYFQNVKILLDNEEIII